jgi:hypothetical protein
MSQHTSESELANTIKNINIRSGDIYYHYRSPDKYYKILNVALFEANEKPMVVYQALYGKKLIWARNYELWCEEINHNGCLTKRFIQIKNRPFYHLFFDLFKIKNFIPRG